MIPFAPGFFKPKIASGIILFDTFTGGSEQLINLHTPEVGADWVPFGLSSGYAEASITGTGFMEPLSYSATRSLTDNAVAPSASSGFDMYIKVRKNAITDTSGEVPHAEIALFDANFNYQIGIYAFVNTSPESMALYIGYYIFDDNVGNNTFEEIVTTVDNGDTFEVRLTTTDRRNVAFKLDGVTRHTSDLGGQMGAHDHATIYLVRAGNSMNHNGIALSIDEVLIQEV